MIHFVKERFFGTVPSPYHDGLLSFLHMVGFMTPTMGELNKLPPNHPQRDVIMEAYLNDVITNVAPFTPLMLIGVILIQFALLLFIFKRREK